jgi:radical SAM-linked protein
VRTRDQNEIIRQTETQLGNTGYDEVTLLSLSTSDYPDIASLATKLAKRLAPKRISVALPSLRPGTISPQLLDAVSKVRKAGLTLAPEAGTERLRLFIRKDFCDEAIYDTVRLAFEKGWTTLKLYFMIGLPTETEKDLLGIIDVIRRVYEIGRNTNGRKTINITLSPFAPKPHTPFQWDEVCSPEVIKRKIGFLRHHNRIRNVHFKYTSTETNMLQAVLGRGGREMGRVILAAYNKGCRFDGWTDHFKFSKWAEAFTECGIELADHLKPIPFSNPLPWGHITKGPSAEHLQKERERTSATLKDYTPWQGRDDKADEPETPAMSFGRATKKAPTRAVVAPTKSRVRLMWGKTARYKYMSHLDNLRTLERAIRRSDMPIAYSQGFNPSMKLSFGPPLPLGFTSEAELVDITLDTNIMPYMINNLKLALPDGIYIVDSRVVFTKAKSISSLLNRVIYTVPFKEKWNESDLNDKVTALLDSQTLEIERVGKSGTKVVDLRPGIYDLKVENDLLVMTMGVGDGGYVRPSELLRLLTEDDDDAYLAYMVHRKEMYRVDENGEKIHPMDL